MAAPSYDHTQEGVATFVLLALGIALATIAGLGLATLTGPGWIVWLPLAITVVIFFAILVVFSRLQVWIETGELKWRFGFGFPSYRLPLEEITSATVVKNSWMYGYGIRIIPRGMLYNISGSDAVELVRRDKKVVRIGTDEPQALLEAIHAATPTLRL